MARAVDGHALPWLEALDSRDRILAALEEAQQTHADGRPQGGVLWAGTPAVLRAVLLSRSGATAAAADVLRAEAARSTAHRGYLEWLSELRQRLSLAD